MHIVTCNNDKHWAKFFYWGRVKIQLRFVDWHPVGTFRVLNPKLFKINLIDGVTFLKKLYDKWDKIEKHASVWVCDEGTNNYDGELVPENNKVNDDSNEVSNDTDCNEEVQEHLFEYESEK